MPPLTVLISNEQSDLSIEEKSAVLVATEVVAHEGQQWEEVSIRFVDQPVICSLHKEYFNDPSPTDCISFPLGDPGGVLGEVVVCPSIAIAYAEEHGEDPYCEATLYLVHGLLHLMGYDDINDRDRLEMRKAEAKHLAHLQKKRRLLHSSE